ncbi:hypothetical protein LSAT2_015814 [Lamellibrachia satsuma]|nr:hypothetical protein LSAT2_015814 [Lamellibrachia satsuma]
MTTPEQTTGSRQGLEQVTSSGSTPGQEQGTLSGGTGEQEQETLSGGTSGQEQGTLSGGTGEQELGTLSGGTHGQEQGTLSGGTCGQEHGTLSRNYPGTGASGFDEKHTWTQEEELPKAFHIAYGMMDWLQPIMKLNLFFQEKDVDIARVKMKVDLCLAELEKMKSTPTTDAPENTFTAQLKTDLEEVTFKGHHKVTKNAAHINTVKDSFLGTMIANLKKSEQTHQHKDEVYRSAPYIHASVEAVLEEWQLCKTTVTTLKYTIAKLADLWQILARFHAEEFPNLIKLAYLAVTHPVHSCDCERTFSVQNLTLTSLRSRLSIEHCDQLMRCTWKEGGLPSKSLLSARLKMTRRNMRKHVRLSPPIPNSRRRSAARRLRPEIVASHPLPRFSDVLLDAIDCIRSFSILRSGEVSVHLSVICI